jgi:hypothetical protein
MGILSGSVYLDPMSQQYSLMGEVHIGARALHVLNLIWFGNIARLSHNRSGEEGGNFLVQRIYLPSLSVEGGGVGTLGSLPTGSSVLLQGI